MNERIVLRYYLTDTVSIYKCVVSDKGGCQNSGDKFCRTVEKGTIVHFAALGITGSEALFNKLLTIMAKSKRKKTKFTAGKEARRRARELAGPPPAGQIIPDKRKKPLKHKNVFSELNDFGT